MAFGKPVVSFRSGGAPEMILDGETGVLVPGGDVSAMGRAMIRLGKNPQLRSALGTAGRRRAEASFSHEKHLEKMEALFLDMQS